MIRFFKKTKGVISVFLILILVPTMVFSAVLVDGSRMVSARAISQEAADLAALSALSNYHTTLKEEFGLFALKDASSAETVFQESLKATLQASGLGDQTYSEQVWDIMKGAFGANNPYLGKDFMNLYDFQLDQSSVTPLYTLANPEVLQNQIVEYSKYRGLYVISERLGLLDQISKIAEQADEQEKATDAMEEKMDVDEKNGAADKKVLVVQQDIDALNGKLSGMEGQRFTYFNYLTAEMDVLAEVENLSEEVKKAAEDYNQVKGEVQTYFTGIDPSAEALHNDIPPAKNEVEKAISRLNNYIGKYAGSGNETIKELVEDAREDVKAYQKTLQDLETTNNDTVFNTVYNNKTGSQIAGVIGGIDTAVHRYSSEKDDEDEEENYKFYYYDLESSTEDAGEARADYSDIWTDTLQIAPDSQVPQVVSSNGHYLGDAAEDTDMKEKAEEKSGSQQEVENMKSDPAPKSIEGNIYQALPSKTFDPKAEAATYGSVIAEDLNRAVSGGEAVHVAAEQSADMNYDFYNEDGNLSGSKSILSSNKNSFLTQLGNVAEAGRDEVLTLSYIFGTFKTRLTENDKFQKGALEESKKDKFYIVGWRYLHDGGEQDLQFSPKKDRETRLNAEIEYLIYGLSSDQGNEAAVYASIYAPRMANNMIALYNNKTVKGSCDVAATAASAVTLGSVPPTVFFWIFLTAWTVAETILDMHYLIDEGYRIPLFKTKDTVLLELDMNAASGGLVENYKKGSSDKNIYVCYEDYLLMFLLLKSSKARLMRTADLVEMNMQLADSGFEIDQAYTYLRAKSDLSIRYLFLTAPVFSEEYQRAGLGGRLKFENVIYQGY